MLSSNQFFSLRARILLLIVVLLLLLVVVLLLFSNVIIAQSFEQVEQQAVTVRVEQVVNALDNSRSGLLGLALDYAAWDDSYAFVQDGNPEYIELNFRDLSFLIDNNVSYVGFVNRAGEVVYAVAYDHVTESEIAPPAALTSFTGEYAQLLQHEHADGALSGLLLLDELPMLIAAHPILPSIEQGEPAGTLIMGRALDETEVARLAEITRLPFTLARLDAPVLEPLSTQLSTAIAAAQTPNPDSLNPPIITDALNTQTIVGATILPDLLERGGLLLTLELPREVFLLAQNTTRDYTLVLLGAGLLFGVLVWVTLERVVLTRLLRLDRQVQQIDAEHPDVQLDVSGHDEISQLAMAINQMLSRLTLAQLQIINAQRYRQLIELSPDAIVVHDGQQIRYINTAGARLLADSVPPALIGQQLDPLLRAVSAKADGTPVMTDQVFTRADGAQIELELVVLPFPDHELDATQVIMRNITERKQVEKELRLAKVAADAANRAKSQFISTMSHELRTPLTAILGYADLLKSTLSDADNAEALQTLSHIRNAGTHLLAIINDVLDLSKIEAGQMQVHVDQVHVDVLSSNVTDAVRPLAERNGNQIAVRGVDAVGVLQTDEVRLRQILLNLLSNACKFTHNGTITLEVTAIPDAGPDNDLVRFAVHDTGIGIRPEDLARLFQDFVQVDSSTTRKYGGTGLGLALSRRLAQLIGGEITLTSEVGVGSIFTLTVPRTLTAEQLNLTALPTPSPAMLANPLSSPLKPKYVESQIVLVIDDDPAILDLLPRLLAQPNLHFETASDGREGLELAAALLPDLIILDVLLPELDGWSVLHELKQNSETHDIPVLMLTFSPDAQQGLVLGAAGILNKPVDIERVAHAIAAALHGAPAAHDLLLVEDDPDLRGYFRRTLERDGWQVREAESGTVALALLVQQLPALAVIDLMLPGIDGITLIGAIRRMPGGNTLPILVVTAKDLSVEEQVQLNASVEQVLRKGSFHSDELLRNAQALVRWRTPVAPKEQ
ncbi:MAG: response regulator [Chloroflexaceae bacterium]|nr:response regulator [Chloroflexaceae bacterium]